MATAPRPDRIGRTTESLERELAYYRELFEEGPEPYLVTDVNVVIVEANEAAAALFGIPRHRLRRKPLAGLVARDDRATFRAAMVEAVRAGEPSEWEARVVPRVGPEVHVSVLVRPRRTDGRQTDSLLVMFRDVTARRAVELEVRTLNAELEWRVGDRTAELAEANRRNERLLALEKRARRHLAALLDRLQHGVVVVDRDLGVEFANRAADDLLGGGRVREGMPLPEPFHDFSLRDFAAALFEHDDPVTEVALAYTGGERMYSLGGIPAGGSNTAVLLVSDISERERRERAQRDFITNAAHELQTPLTAIASATEVLQSGAKNVPEQRDRFLAHIEKAAARLARLTRGLLMLARAQALGENPRFERVDAAEVLDAVRRDFAPSSGVQIEVACEPGLFVAATRELLEQAVGELLTNALKHTRHGTISLAAAAVDGDRIAVSVCDTGTGFAASEAARVLDRFYRAADGTGDGFGLGLSIVHQIVGALGGEIAISSSPGEGTRARMILRGVGMRGA